MTKAVNELIVVVASLGRALFHGLRSFSQAIHPTLLATHKHTLRHLNTQTIDLRRGSVTKTVRSSWSRKTHDHESAYLKSTQRNGVPRKEGWICVRIHTFRAAEIKPREQRTGKETRICITFYFLHLRYPAMNARLGRECVSEPPLPVRWKSRAKLTARVVRARPRKL